MVDHHLPAWDLSDIRISEVLTIFGGGLIMADYNSPTSSIIRVYSASDIPTVGFGSTTELRKEGANIISSTIQNAFKQACGCTITSHEQISFGPCFYCRRIIQDQL